MIDVNKSVYGYRELGDKYTGVTGIKGLRLHSSDTDVYPVQLETGP